MTGSKCIVDTSIIIDVFKAQNKIAEQLDAFAVIYVPAIVVGELYYGAFKSSNALKHIAQIRAFLANCIILLSDAETAHIYGMTKAVLVRKGKPLPENDIWIAAVAQQYSLPLFTRDLHFNEIENVILIR